jgi:hypothetical protein
MKAAYTLKDEICWSDISKQKVGIDIDGLLHDLGSDKDTPLGALLESLPKQCCPMSFILLSLELGESAVHKTNRSPAVVESGFELSKGFLRGCNRIAHHQHTRSALSCRRGLANPVLAIRSSVGDMNLSGLQTGL